MSVSSYLMRSAGVRLLQRGLPVFVPTRFAAAVATTAPVEVEHVEKRKPDMWDNWGTVYIPDYQLEKWDKDFKEGPKRDLVNFPHPEHQKYISKVRLGFLPNSWFEFFYNKTGVTGPYIFGWGLVSFIFTKEIVPWEGEWFNLPALLAHMYLINRLLGAQITKFFTEERLKDHIPYKTAVDEEKTQKQDFIADLSDYSNRLSVLTDYNVAHMKERVYMQMEIAYRQRLQEAYAETKRRLDYLSEVEDAKRRFQQKHMVQWIVQQVMKGITPEKEKQLLAQCVSDLKALAAK